MVAFAVVEFTQDLSVEVVPSNWIFEDTCLWPPFRGLRFTAAAKKCETPTQLWKKYPIRVMGTYDTYEIARGKLALSEETSTLETDVEDTSASRNRRKKSFPDFDDTELPEDEPVSLKKHTSQPVERQALHRMPTPPSSLAGIFDTPVQGQRRSPRKAQTSSLSSKGLSSSSGLNDSQSPPPHRLRTLTQLTERSTPSTLVRSSSVTPSSIFGNSPNPTPRRPQPSTSTQMSESSTPTMSVRRSSVARSSRFGDSPNPPPRRPQPSTQMSKSSAPTMSVQGSSMVPTVVSSVSGQLKLILAKLSVIDQCQRHQTEVSNQILNVLQHRDEVDNLPDSIKEKVPMQTLDDVRFVEEQLEERKTFSKLTRHMGAIGGKDVAETTRNVMKNLMTNGVAARMNFVGRGGKTAIKNMKLLHVITGAVRRNKRLKNVTAAEIETVVKLWLRYARDRSGGRQARLEKQSSDQPTVLSSDEDLY